MSIYNKTLFLTHGFFEILTHLTMHQPSTLKTSVHNTPDSFILQGWPKNCWVQFEEQPKHPDQDSGKVKCMPILLTYM